MTWQTVIILQVIVSAGMTILTRRLALAERKLFFVIGVLSYAVVALMGFVYTLVFAGGLPHLPHGQVWLYLVAEGGCVPAAWLLQYKIIGYLGASNTVLVSMLNNVASALLGIIFLHDKFSLGFIAGTGLVLSSIVIVFRVQPDSRHQQPASTLKKISLIAAMVGLYAVGLFSEKRAIDTIGVWNYASFGWLLQLIGALALCSFYGRHELSHATWRGVQKGLTLGFVTSLAGGLFIYALSIGTLSHTIIANSGKVALTTLFAAIFLHERNALQQRLLAFVLSMGGLWFLVQ